MSLWCSKFCNVWKFVPWVTRTHVSLNCQRLQDLEICLLVSSWKCNFDVQSFARSPKLSFGPIWKMWFRCLLIFQILQISRLTSPGQCCVDALGFAKQRNLPFGKILVIAFELSNVCSVCKAVSGFRSACVFRCCMAMLPVAVASPIFDLSIIIRNLEFAQLVMS